MVRTILPSIIPPSYRGATIRYLYYVRSTLRGQYLLVGNGHFREESIRDLAELVSSVCHSLHSFILLQSPFYEYAFYFIIWYSIWPWLPILNFILKMLDGCTMNNYINMLWLRYSSSIVQQCEFIVIHFVM